MLVPPIDASIEVRHSCLPQKCQNICFRLTGLALLVGIFALGVFGAMHAGNPTEALSGIGLGGSIAILTFASICLLADGLRSVRHLCS